jgi:hypothetical protein
MVDLPNDLICSTSAPWDEIGLTYPPDSLLKTAVHPEDLGMFRHFLLHAPVVPAGRPVRTEVRMRADSGWRSTRVAALRLDGILDDGQVMIRIS